ncbi:flagellar biosynthesis pathway protein FliR [Hahella sp. CCB-MM4]|uniref:flagellar biosynthetic protein FliR n=1 Tax=Hahella sp. (strain CCB-MM4) TaxID=1926491 RepID=UPI000B9B0698|nr:flagellar biosynthetic protein FliR [Hahella sp. CCB-MM4]OZG74856.1 flagellar biosynthesis pathway protein FliR [Hahella sp. CCB-MM4]
MTFQFDMGWIWSVALLSVRMSTIFYLSVLDLFGRVPGRFRLMLIVVLSALLISANFSAVTPMPETLIEMLLGLTGELVLSVMLVLGLHAAFSAFQVAGRMIDFQSGFGAASLLNPATNSADPLIGTLLLFVAAFVFFSVDGHHLLLKGLVFSVQQVPLGSWGGGMNFSAVLHHYGLMFLLGMTIAAPVLAVLFFVDAGLAVMGKTMPQMNVYFIFLPLKVALGIGMTALSLKYMMPLISEVISSVFRYWDQVITAA